MSRKLPTWSENARQKWQQSDERFTTGFAKRLEMPRLTIQMEHGDSAHGRCHGQCPWRRRSAGLRRRFCPLDGSCLGGRRVYPLPLALDSPPINLFTEKTINYLAGIIPTINQYGAIMTKQRSYARPEMSQAFQKVLGEKAVRQIEVPREIKHGVPVSAFLKTLNSAYEAARKSNLVFK